jgi:hypothetical protein
MVNIELIGFQVRFLYSLFKLNRLSLEPEPKLKTSEPEPKAPKVPSSRAWSLGSASAYGQH